VFDDAFARILRADSIRDFVAVATANPEDLYSLDPQDYQAARRLVLEAVTKFVEQESQHQNGKRVSVV
jgi:hypothetical protein